MYSNAYENNDFTRARNLIANKEFRKAYNLLQSKRVGAMLLLFLFDYKVRVISLVSGIT